MKGIFRENIITSYIQFEIMNIITTYNILATKFPLKKCKSISMDAFKLSFHEKKLSLKYGFQYIMI